VEERAGEIGGGWGELLDDEFALAEAGVKLRVGVEEGGWGAVLPGESGLDRINIGVEGGDGGGRGLGGRSAGSGGEYEESAEGEESLRS
jgi:hypothetical protein